MSECGFYTTFNKYDYPLDMYVGEAYIFPNKIHNAVRVSLGGKPVREYRLMYYFCDRDNIPKRLKIMFGYIKGERIK